MFSQREGVLDVPKEFAEVSPRIVFLPWMLQLETASLRTRESQGKAGIPIRL